MDSELTVQLTSRERQVLLRLADGDSDEEIAVALFISVSTVKSHNRHIYDKLGIRGRRETRRWRQPWGGIPFGVDGPA